MLTGRSPAEPDARRAALRSRLGRAAVRGRRGRTKREQRERSVSRLLDAALGFFVTEGYRGTTIERIAAAAGLTKGAVYFYFKSKAGVLMRLLDRAEALIVDPTLAAMTAAGDRASDRLVAFMHTQSLVTTEAPERLELSRLLLLMSLEFRGTGNAIDKRLERVLARFDAAITETVEAGIRQGEFRGDLGLRETVGMILAVNQGCFLEWYRHPGGLDGPAFVRAMRLMVLAGIGADAAKG